MRLRSAQYPDGSQRSDKEEITVFERVIHEVFLPPIHGAGSGAGVRGVTKFKSDYKKVCFTVPVSNRGRRKQGDEILGIKFLIGTHSSRPQTALFSICGNLPTSYVAGLLLVSITDGNPPCQYLDNAFPPIPDVRGEAQICSNQASGVDRLCVLLRFTKASCRTGAFSLKALITVQYTVPTQRYRKSKQMEERVRATGRASTIYQMPYVARNDNLFPNWSLGSLTTVLIQRFGKRRQ